MRCKLRGERSLGISSEPGAFEQSRVCLHLNSQELGNAFQTRIVSIFSGVNTKFPTSHGEGGSGSATTELNCTLNSASGQAGTRSLTSTESDCWGFSSNSLYLFIAFYSALTEELVDVEHEHMVPG